jgi:hypothetical protein
MFAQVYKPIRFWIHNFVVVATLALPRVVLCTFIGLSCAAIYGVIYHLSQGHTFCELWDGEVEDSRGTFEAMLLIGGITGVVVGLSSGVYRAWCNEKQRENASTATLYCCGCIMAWVS